MGRAGAMRATERWCQTLLLVMLVSLKGCSAQARAIETGAQLAQALQAQQPPDSLLLAADVLVQTHDWPAGQSIIIYKNITIQGAVPNGSNITSPTLDWNWVSRAIALVPGVWLTFRGLTLKGFSPTLDNNFAFMSFAPGARLELHDVILFYPTGFPNAVTVPGILAAPLPSSWPTGSQQHVEALPDCYSWQDGQGSRYCFNESFKLVNFAIEVPTTASGFWGSGGYIACLFNTIVTQPVLMTAECLNRSGHARCYRDAVEASMQPQLRPPGPSAAADDHQEVNLTLILPVTIIGSMVLAATAIGCLWWFKRRMQVIPPSLRKYMAPSHGEDTTIVVTDIMGSTAMWESLPSSVMDCALKLHHACIRHALASHNGTESTTEGDSFILCFHTTQAAVNFCLDTQEQLMLLEWPELLLSHELGRTLWAVPQRGHAVLPVAIAIREDDDALVTEVTANVDDGSFQPSAQPPLARTHASRRGSMYVDARLPRRSSHNGRLSLEITSVNAGGGGGTRRTPLRSCSWYQHLCSQWQVTDHPERLTVQDDIPAYDAPSYTDWTLVLRGLRVRMGVHAGVTAGDVVQNPVAGRTQYIGDALEKAKIVCNMAQGGMVLLSAEAFQQATAGPVLEDAAIVHLGEFLSNEQSPKDAGQPLYAAVRPSLLTRLVAIPGPSKQLQVSAGTLEAPVGSVTIAFNYIVGFSSLQSWSHDLAVSAADMFAALATEKLRLHNGYLVEMDRGFCLAAFASPLDAIMWSHDCKNSMINLSWPAALLEHALCEEVMDDDTATVLMRGPRIKVGIDTAAEVCTETSPATGRMTYRGKVMNRAARVASKATSGKVFVSADCWRACGSTPQELVEARSQGIMDLKGVGAMEIFCTSLVEPMDALDLHPEIPDGFDSRNSLLQSLNLSVPPSGAHARTSDGSKRSVWTTWSTPRRRMVSAASVCTQTDLTWPAGSVAPELVASGGVQPAAVQSAHLLHWGAEMAEAVPVTQLPPLPEDGSSNGSPTLHIIIDCDE